MARVVNYGVNLSVVYGTDGDMLVASYESIVAAWISGEGRRVEARSVTTARHMSKIRVKEFQIITQEEFDKFIKGFRL